MLAENVPEILIVGYIGDIEVSEMGEMRLAECSLSPVFHEENTSRWLGSFDERAQHLCDGGVVPGRQAAPASQILPLSVFLAQDTERLVEPGDDDEVLLFQGVVCGNPVHEMSGHG